MHKKPKHLDISVGGDLSLTGTNKVEINLGHREPMSVLVWFTDSKELFPCNPQHLDALEYKVERVCDYFKDKFVLVICWEVEGFRNIEWKAIY